MANYTAEGSVTIGFWAKIGGTWTKVATQEQYVTGSYSSGGVKTLGWSTTKAITASGSVSDFRVTLDGYSGTSAAITALSNVTWSTQTSGSTRSATPSGQTSHATVQP